MMKLLTTAAAAALLFTAPAVAQMSSGSDPDGRQGVMDPNGPNVPPGDGITMRGHDPEGQAFTPPGYNDAMPMRAYPPLAAAPAGLIGGDYPVCSARVTDRCVQAYTRYTRTAARRR
jgi:hypothetical protein